MSWIALPWLVLDGGGTAASAGLVFALSVAPYVAFGLIAGVVGDRHNRRRIMWIAHATQVAAALVIPGWFVFGHPPLGVVLAAAIAIGTARVFVDAAVFGAIAAIIGRERFTEGQATLSAAWAIGYFIGPALGGVLIAAVGPAFALVAEAAMFVCAMAMILLVCRPLDAEDRGAPESATAMAREGLAVIWRTPRVRSYTWLSIAWNLAAATSAALSVPLLRETLGLSSVQAGVVLAIGSFVAIGVPALLGRLVPRHGPGPVAAALTGLSAVSIVATGLAPGFATVAVANGFRNLADFALLSTIIGERQRGVPDRLQARVGITGRMIAVAAIAGGGLIGAALADPLGVRGVFMVSGIGVALAFAITIPGVLRAGRG